VNLKASREATDLAAPLTAAAASFAFLVPPAIATNFAPDVPPL